MVKCEGTYIEMRGDIIRKIGPELTMLIGSLYDKLKCISDEKMAERFIEIIVDIALDRNVPEDVRQEIDFKVKAHEGMPPEAIWKEYGYLP